jgi:hypothetical protein
VWHPAAIAGGCSSSGPFPIGRLAPITHQEFPLAQLAACVGHVTRHGRYNDGGTAGTRRVEIRRDGEALRALRAGAIASGGRQTGYTFVMAVSSRVDSRASQSSRKTGGVVGDGQGVTVMPVAELELALEVGAPQIVGRRQGTAAFRWTAAAGCPIVGHEADHRVGSILARTTRAGAP